MDLFDFLIVWRTHIKWLGNLLFSSTHMFQGQVFSEFSFFNLTFGKITYVKLRDRMTFGQVWCISADHRKEWVRLKSLALVDVNLNFHRCFSCVVHKTFNLDIFLWIDRFKKFQRLYWPSDQCKWIVTLKGSKTVSVTHKARDHILYFKESSDPNEFFVITNELVPELTVLSNVKVYRNVRILKMVEFRIWNNDFLVLLNFNLLLENVCRDQVLQIDWGIY